MLWINSVICAEKQIKWFNNNNYLPRARLFSFSLYASHVYSLLYSQLYIPAALHFWLSFGLLCFSSTQPLAIVVFYSHFSCPWYLCPVSKGLLWPSTAAVVAPISSWRKQQFLSTAPGVLTFDGRRTRILYRVTTILACPNLGGRCTHILSQMTTISFLLCRNFRRPFSVPFPSLVASGTVAPVKNKVFRYHEDGSKKFNACIQFFLCMVYF